MQRPDGEPARKPADLQPVVVVAAAILDDGRLLAAQRRRPAQLAGRWELPGGKVEPGETDETALARECREELGVGVVLGRRVGGDWPLPAGRVLRVWTARLRAERPVPGPDHLALRWLAPGTWDDLDWLDPDRPVIAAVAAAAAAGAHADADEVADGSAAGVADGSDGSAAGVADGADGAWSPLPAGT